MKSMGLDLTYCYWPRPEFHQAKGPWQHEPDHAQFEHAGLPCLIVRHPRRGSLCGYAGVFPGHPLYEVTWSETDQLSDAPAHMGINYSAHCDEDTPSLPKREGLICHVPRPGEPGPVWWFGFDCAHLFDFDPRAALEHEKPYQIGAVRQNYRDIRYVESVCRKLAQWLSER